MRRLLLRVKRGFQARWVNDSFRMPQCKCPKRRFGSAYGGWDVATQDIRSDSIVYSFGLGEDASFEIALINDCGITVHSFDPTPKSIEWITTQSMPDRFVFHAYGVASYDGLARFCRPRDPDHVSYSMAASPFCSEDGAISAPVKRLPTIMRELGHETIEILKMDIEGAEYAVIQDLAQSSIRPIQLLVEFHHRFPSVGLSKTREAVRQLKRLGYRLFSVSASALEYCFVYRPDRRFDLQGR